MKKSLIVSLNLVFIMLCFASPAKCNPFTFMHGVYYEGSIYTYNDDPRYYGSDDAYIQDSLDYLPTYIGTEDYRSDNVTSLTDHNPGFSWDYVVINWENVVVASFKNIGDNDLLTTYTSEDLAVAISPDDQIPIYNLYSISYYTDRVPVPEPATMLLLGCGLLGLAGLKRKVRKN